MISIRPLSNFDIDTIFKHNKFYGGCFSKDLVKKNCKEGYFYILNMDKENSRGTHWIMLSLVDKHNNFYYDSFSVPSPLCVQRFLSQQKKPYLTNPYYQNEQCINSITCGFFCAYMAILQTNIGLSPQDCIDFFKGDTKNNEDIIQEFAKEILKRLKSVKE